MTDCASPKMNEISAMPHDKQRRPKWLHEVITAVVSELRLTGGEPAKDGHIVGQVYSFPDDPVWLGAAEHQLRAAIKWLGAAAPSQIAKDLSSHVFEATRKPLSGTLAHCLHRVQRGAAHVGDGVPAKSVVSDLRRAASAVGELIDHTTPKQQEPCKSSESPDTPTNGFFSARDLAERYNKPKDAVRKRLERWRLKNQFSLDLEEVKTATSNTAKYRYRESGVYHVIETLPTERP